MLNIGDSAPEFELTDQHGELISLQAELATGGVILYFYPADFSPVCTAEACTFRDNYAGVEDVGLTIIGISPQSEKSHERFAAQYDIPFSLLGDPGKKVIRAYGVDGPFGMGVRRATFHIDQSGLVKNRVVADFFVGSHVDLLKQAVADSD